MECWSNAAQLSNTPTLLHSTHPPLRSAFTLIEFIAVLAVVAILAAIIFPVVIRRTDRAAWIKEVNDMTAISNALVLQISRTFTIPGATNWAQSAADWAARPVSQILTNNRGFARLFLYESGGWLAGNVPYTQGSTGTVAAANVRIVIVSTIAEALPYTNGAIDTASFNSIWNVAQSAKPSFFSTWTGRGEDLVIQRLNLDSLFHRLVLLNRDPTPSPAAYSINSTNTRLLTNWTSSYYLDGTVVGLCSYTLPMYRFVLGGDVSYAFDAGMWRSTFGGGGKDNSDTAKAFVAQTSAFLSVTNTAAGAARGASSQGSVSAMFAFMYTYSLWANRCPHFYYSGNNQSAATEYLILESLGGNSQIIDAVTGNNGLLK